MKEKILIVDDEKNNIQLLGEQLRGEKYMVAAAYNGQNAIKIAEKILPDLILLDVVMPDMLGFEVCQYLKENASTKNIPVIFLTAKADAESITKGFSVGAVDYLTKPFYKQELLMRVKTHLKLRKTEHLQELLKEKEVLLKEIHHRVKNNLQVISGLLGMQSRSIKDKQLNQMFTDTQNRIQSIALIHEKLYQSQNLAYVDFKDYLSELSQHLFHAYAVNTNDISLSIEVEKVVFDVEMAISCGMIINEAVSNAFKYAFPNSVKGSIEIIVKEESQRFVLSVTDNGVGFLPSTDYSKSLGMRLMNLFAEQLEGDLHINGDSGVVILLNFPKNLE